LSPEDVYTEMKNTIIGQKRRSAFGLSGGCGSQAIIVAGKTDLNMGYFFGVLCVLVVLVTPLFGEAAASPTLLGLGVDLTGMKLLMVDPNTGSAGKILWRSSMNAATPLSLQQPVWVLGFACLSFPPLSFDDLR